MILKMLKHTTMQLSADIEKLPRNFLPQDFTIKTWDDLAPFFEDLETRSIDSAAALELWMQQCSELEAAISEEVCWRQIKMTCDTENTALEESFNYFMLEIQPKIQPVADRLNKKLIQCQYTALLDEKSYFTYLRNIKKNIELFREENIPLQASLSVLQQQFGVISGKMTVTIEGNEYTLQQAARFLEDPDRQLRRDTYFKIQQRRYDDHEALNQLFTELLEKRNQLAANTGYKTYTEYRFAELGRFDYTPADCYAFHNAVKEHVMPLVDDIYRNKKAALGVEVLKPWDVDAEPEGVEPLKPFKNGDELLQKSVDCLQKLYPYFAQCLQKMETLGHLDLESRKGKAPGGYNCPLAESGAPFIFMNAAGTMDDVTTMVHESGHAIHSFLSHPLPLTGFKEYPTEIAEVASMSMELFTMEYWDSFLNNNEELVRAKQQQLERVITLFPWVATIDKFQHWLYSHPNHTPEERQQNWLNILNEFSSGEIDFTDVAEFRKYSWQRQLHLFEVPFYYIEYAIAQLGAIGMWMQFKNNQEQALQNYIYALSLGGTQTLPQLFNAAGLQFDFSGTHIKQLMDFVEKEMKSLA